MSEEILFAALPDSSASFLTSSATTAKPLPCSPARAASIAAFKASKFVCAAMLVMTVIISPISCDLLSSNRIASVVTMFWLLM